MTKKEFIKLSWELLEAKVRYEYIDGDISTSMTDHEYDTKSIEYLTACRELKMPNTIIHKAHPGFEDINLAPIGIDLTKPSVDLILNKIHNRQCY